MATPCSAPWRRNRTLGELATVTSDAGPRAPRRTPPCFSPAFLSQFRAGLPPQPACLSAGTLPQRARRSYMLISDAGTARRMGNRGPLLPRQSSPLPGCRGPISAVSRHLDGLATAPRGSYGPAPVRRRDNSAAPRDPRPSAVVLNGAGPVLARPSPDLEGRLRLAAVRDAGEGRKAITRAHVLFALLDEHRREAAEEE